MKARFLLAALIPILVLGGCSKRSVLPSTAAHNGSYSQTRQQVQPSRRLYVAFYNGTIGTYTLGATRIAPTLAWFDQGRAGTVDANGNIYVPNGAGSNTHDV